MVEFKLNGAALALDVDPETPLLWVLRDNLGLTGTKFGCGMGLCGACTVHLEGLAVRSCSTPLSAVADKTVTTIESFAGNHPLQRAWVAHNVPQCGYCQSGQIMSAAALLEENPSPSDEEIRAAMSGNLCRCGTYNKIRRAIHAAAGTGTDSTVDNETELGTVTQTGSANGSHSVTGAIIFDPAVESSDS